jgi:UDP-N-acetyl-D-mannosaminuronic acid transferase (WecB/TagA/CpsF family)/anti-anti-sigma regulatory factor
MKAVSLLSTAEATPVRSPPSLTRLDHRWPVAMLGAPIENLSVAAAVERIAAMITTGRPHLVTIATAARLLRAQADKALVRQLAEADLVLHDSASLGVASWWFGNRLRSRVRPNDLASRLAQLAVIRGWRVFLLGSTAADVVSAESRLRRYHPKLTFVGSYAPGPGKFDGAAAESAITTARPNLLFVWSDSAALDAWLARRHPQLGAAVSLHFPGCCAPLRLESRERAGPPAATGRTWRERFRNLGKLLPSLWHSWRRLSFATGRGSGLHVVRSDESWLDVIAGESLTRASLERHPSVWRYDVIPTAHCAVDVSRVTHIDATGIAFLARHRAACRRAHRQFVLVAPSPAVRGALAQSQLLELFDTAATAAEARQLGRAPAASANAGITRSLAWCGEIIAGNHDDVWQMTTDYVRTFCGMGASLIVIDLARLRFIDATGALLMTRVKTWARGLRVEVLFAHPQPQIASALRVAGLDTLLLEGAQ